jgi:cell division protein FtsB
MNMLLLRRNISSVIAIVVLIVLGILVAITLRIYMADQEEMNALSTEVTKLKNKVTILRNNKTLAQEEINEYNKMLTQLIPDKEDFFSVVYALEELSLKTGFQVTGYSVNITQSSREKYALTVQGDGDPNSFLEFLKNYQFAGGRLITNEKIEFTNEEVGKIKLSLNFYSKSIPTKADVVVQISQKDLQLMEEIKGKTTFVFKAGSEDATSYPTKDNPF